MNAIEIDREMVNIALTMYEECKARFNATPKELKTERKALKIESEMYGLCLRAGLLADIQHPEKRDDFFNIRKNVTCQILRHYTKPKAAFDALDECERERFHAAIHGELFMKDQITKGWAGEFEEAKSAADTAKIFELQIMLGATDRIYKAWEAWRIENNIYPNMFADTQQ